MILCQNYYKPILNQELRELNKDDHCLLSSTDLNPQNSRLRKITSASVPRQPLMRSARLQEPEGPLHHHLPEIEITQRELQLLIPQYNVTTTHCYPIVNNCRKLSGVNLLWEKYGGCPRCWPPEKLAMLFGWTTDCFWNINSGKLSAFSRLKKKSLSKYLFKVSGSKYWCMTPSNRNILKGNSALKDSSHKKKLLK